MRKISFGVLVLILLCGCSVYRKAASAETEDKQKEKTELISVDDRLPSMTLKLRNSVMRPVKTGNMERLMKRECRLFPWNMISLRF